MIDKQARRSAETAISEYLGMTIGSHELDKVLWDCRAGDDATCNAICSAMWHFHSDTEDHTNTGKWRIEDASEEMIRRWIDILKSEWEIAEPIRLSFVTRVRRIVLGYELPFSDNKYWPFESKDDWDSWARENEEPDTRRLNGMS